jgi:Flp pilus assembly pilin Flp
MKTLLKTFLRNDSGAALVEYGIALLVVILVGTAALVTLSQNTQIMFGGAAQSSTAARTAACTAVPAPPGC